MLTNDHVASTDASCEMTIWGVNSIKDTPDLVAYAESIPGARDQRIDLAVVRLVNERGNPITIPGRSPIDIPRKEIKLGTPMKLLGFPGMGGVRISMTPGEQSGWWEDEEFDLWSEKFYKTSAKMGPGISGGAAFNAETGEFIGVPTGFDEATDGRGDILGLVRPGRYALPLLDAAERAG